MILSIVICTYNRAELLRFCLQSLCEQNSNMQDVEILVINNNSSDNTLEVTDEFKNKLEDFRVVTETNQGLSHARNRGYLEAKGDWVCYLDDDAKAHVDMVTESLNVIKLNAYSCFGGVYLPWYKYGQPKWFKDKYGSNKKPYDKPTVLLGDSHLSGGIFFVKRNLLNELNGFLTSLGMTGKKVAYGEETELQLRIREKGLETVYIPAIKIDHLVPEYKLHVDWFLRGAEALGRDQVKMGMVKASSWSYFKQACIMMGLTAIDAIRHGFKLFKSDYYIENWKIDALRKYHKRKGVLGEIIKQTFKSK